MLFATCGETTTRLRPMRCDASHARVVLQVVDSPCLAEGEASFALSGRPAHQHHASAAMHASSA
jgi:hypothetical protein